MREGGREGGERTTKKGWRDERRDGDLTEETTCEDKPFNIWESPGRGA